MRKYLISTILLLLLAGFGCRSARTDIVRRIIFIGDAGEMNKQQQAIIARCSIPDYTRTKQLSCISVIIFIPKEWH